MGPKRKETRKRSPLIDKTNVVAKASSVSPPYDSDQSDSSEDITGIMSLAKYSPITFGDEPTSSNGPLGHEGGADAGENDSTSNEDTEADVPSQPAISVRGKPKTSFKAMITEAITNIDEKEGLTLMKMEKWIKSNYPEAVNSRLNASIKRAITMGTKDGTFVERKTGSYRLNPKKTKNNLKPKPQRKPKKEIIKKKKSTSDEVSDGASDNAPDTTDTVTENSNKPKQPSKSLKESVNDDKKGTKLVAKRTIISQKK